MKRQGTEGNDLPVPHSQVNPLPLAHRGLGEGEGGGGGLGAVHNRSKLKRKKANQDLPSAEGWG